MERFVRTVVVVLGVLALSLALFCSGCGSSDKPAGETVEGGAKGKSGYYPDVQPGLRKKPQSDK